jgi:hypothetical protein
MWNVPVNILAIVLVTTWAFGGCVYWSGVRGASGMPEGGFAGIELMFVHAPTWICLYGPAYVWAIVLFMDSDGTQGSSGAVSKEKSCAAGQGDGGSGPNWRAILAIIWASAVLGSQITSYVVREYEASVWTAAGARAISYGHHGYAGYIHFVGPRENWKVEVLRSSWAARVESVLFDPYAIDEDFAHLRDLPHLTSVQADGSPIGDAGVMHLSGHTSLASLSLSDTAISDRSIAEFNRMPSLTILDVRGTAITEEGLSKLRNPRLSVRSGRSPGRSP